MINRLPDPQEHHPYFSNYISLVAEQDIIGVLEAQPDELRSVLGELDAVEAQKLHAPYTWTITQVLGHCIDTERVFGYRIARFAAGDPSPLVGFDQDAVVAGTDYENVQLSELLDEFEHLRKSNVLMLKRFSDEMWERSGTSDGSHLSVRAGAYILAGHVRHHLPIVRSRIGQ